MNVRYKPIRVEELINGVRLREHLTAAAREGEPGLRERALSLLSRAWRDGRNQIEQRLEAGEDGFRTSRMMARLADEIVGALYDFTTTHVIRASNPTASERFAVIAVGGYGRGQLAPYSDLDLLFLRSYKQTAYSESVTEYMLYMLWDLRLKVGHSSRSLDECIKIAKGDHTVETALLEMRRIAGDRSIAHELAKRFRDEVSSKNHAAFIAAKLAERDARHLRAGASRYMVEPNVKEGKGGLRDLHTLFWLARHVYGYTREQDYVDKGIFSASDMAHFRRALEFMSTVRCHLHVIAGRAEERITFDLQPELALRMGYGSRRNAESVERFMKRYFLVAKRVGSLTRVLCAKLEEEAARKTPRGLERLMPARGKPVAAAPEGFKIESNRLGVTTPATLDNPVNILNLFKFADERGIDIHPVALGETTRRLRLITRETRSDPEMCAVFLDIVASPRDPANALKLMNEAGVLGRFMPEFGRIVAQMQFNMYHHFTVDEHTLHGIDGISQIEKGQLGDRHPLATSIFPKIINRRALYLAMLLHDTGKGEGDQQIEGAKSARSACERLGLPEEEVELISWLVGNHLEMSETAQKRDISDPRTVAKFAKLVGSLEKLRLLLVLTVADIRAVGGGLWNDWKGQLLRDLYNFTEAAFHGGISDEEAIRAQLAETAGAAKAEVLDHLGRPTDATWLDALEDGYWLSHDRDARFWHAEEVLKARRAADIPYVAARARPQQGVTELLVYAKDRPGLFASLAAAIAASGADITDARIHTTRDGAAFDVFSVQTAEHKPFGENDQHAVARLLARLKLAATTDQVLPERQPLPRRTASFAIEPWVRIDNSLSPSATVIEASGRDRPGLLAELAHVLAEARVSITTAHLDPYGERVSDVFYVQEEGGGKIVHPDRIDSLQERLEDVLAAGEPPADRSKRALTVARASTAR